MRVNRKVSSLSSAQSNTLAHFAGTLLQQDQKIDLLFLHARFVTTVLLSPASTQFLSARGLPMPLSSPDRSSCASTDGSLLSMCEQGTDVTTPGSMVSSVSNETSLLEDDAFDIHHRLDTLQNNTDTTLRHRRGIAEDQLLLLEEEEEDCCSFYCSEEEDEECLHYDSDQSKKNRSPRNFNFVVMKKALRSLCWRNKRQKVWTISLIVLVLVCTASYHCWLRSRRWKLPSNKRTRQILDQLRLQPQTFGVTLLIRGHNVDLVHRSLRQHARCPVVKGIQLDWTPDEIVDLLPQERYQNKEIYSASKDETSSSSSAVLLLDEHVLVSCQDLAKAWQEWKQDPTRMVGLVPSSDREHVALVSDSAALVHRFYWRSFQQQRSSTLPTQCQPWALSAWVMALSDQRSVPLGVVLHGNDSTTFPDDCYRHVRHATGKAVLPRTTGFVLGSSGYE